MKPEIRDKVHRHAVEQLIAVSRENGGRSFKIFKIAEDCENEETSIFEETDRSGKRNGEGK